MVKRVSMGLSLLLATTLAHAHAHLVESMPADKGRVAAPVSIELKFNEAVRLTALTIKQGGKKPQALAPLPSKTASSVAVPLPKLEAGDYVVAWRAASADGHVASGTFTFSVDPAAAAAVAGATLPAGADPHSH